jgi:hypothetical protein
MMLSRILGIARIITFAVGLVVVGTFILAGLFNLVGYAPSASSQTTPAFPTLTTLAFSDFVNDVNRGANIRCNNPRSQHQRSFHRQPSIYDLCPR